MRNVAAALLVIAAAFAIAIGGLKLLSTQTWYLVDADGYVALHQGVSGLAGFFGMDEVVQVSDVRVDLLSDALAQRLSEGVEFQSQDAALAALESYASQAAETEKDRRSSVSATVVTAVSSDPAQEGSDDQGQPQGDDEIDGSAASEEPGEDEPADPDETGDDEPAAGEGA